MLAVDLVNLSRIYPLDEFGHRAVLAPSRKHGQAVGGGFKDRLPRRKVLDVGSIGCFIHGVDSFQPRTGGFRDVILGRQQHPEMNALIESMKIHSEAPSTFDGEHPEFVFDRQAGEVSWLVGNQYLVPGPDNVEVMATLQSATVSPQGETMHGVFQTSGVNFVVNA